MSVPAVSKLAALAQRFAFVSLPTNIDLAFELLYCCNVADAFTTKTADGTVLCHAIFFCFMRLATDTATP